MGTPITNLSFKFYRNDTKEDIEDSLVVFENLDSYTPDENGVYTFSKTFFATQNSSFGLEGADNSFRLSVFAKDEAKNDVNLTLDNLEDHLANNAKLEDFSMKVRVKEKSIPVVQKDEDNWKSNSDTDTFTAYFLTWDQNYDYRLAGINNNKNDIIITLDGVQQSSEGIKIEPLEKELNPNYGKDNGEAYRISYTFENLEDKTYQVGITILDNDGNPASAEGQFTVSAIIPAITLTSPKDNGIFGKEEPCEVIGSVTNLANVYIKIYKNVNNDYTELVKDEMIKIDSLDNLNFSRNYNDLQDGSYKIIVKAENINNPNAAAEIERYFIIDRSAPHFTSIKFFPEISDGVFSDISTNIFESGKQYKIVVTVE